MTSTDLMNIAAFKGMAPADAFKVLDPHAESLADGIGSSYGIVGYKGKVWSLRLRGETYNFTRADDGSPAAFLDVIILRQLPNKSKSFYPPNSYQDGQVGTRPICAALNGETPDADIVNPQSNACAVCPRNVFKVSPDGRKTRECSDYKRLAVLILPSQTKALLGAALMEPVFLRVPAASLNDLALLGEGMSGQGFHFSSYITRIGFNPEKPHPQMTFRALQGLTDREAPLVLPMREDATALRITGEGGVTRTAAKPQTIQHEPAQPNPTIEDARVAAAAQAKAAEDARVAAAAESARIQEGLRAAAAAAANKAAAAVASATVDTGFGDLGAAPTATVTRTPNPAHASAAAVDTGFGTVGTSSGTAEATGTANTISDTGAPEEADADLDSRVAALLQR